MLSKYTSGWLLSGVVILPALSLSTYLAWPYYQAKQQEVVTPTVTYTDLPLIVFNTQKLPIQATKMGMILPVDEAIVIELEPVAAAPAVNKQAVKEPVVKEPEALKKTAPPVNEFNVDELDLSGLSPELAARFESILSTPEEEYIDSNKDAHTTKPGIIALVHNGKQFAGRLPAMNFQTHNYTSNPSQRWVKVNGKEVNMGGSITQGIILLDINPRHVMIEFEGQKIEIPALYEWKG